MISSPVNPSQLRDLPQEKSDFEGEEYTSPAKSAPVLRSGAVFRRERIEADDMASTDEAAELVGTSRVTINAWIKSGRCIGISNLRRGFKVPRWQFEPAIWPYVQALSRAMSTLDGWQILSFLETPQMALDGQTPRVALEQGMSGKRILAIALAEAH